MIGLAPVIWSIFCRILQTLRSMLSTFLVNQNLGQIALALQAEDFGLRQADEEQGQEMVPIRQDQQGN